MDKINTDKKWDSQMWYEINDDLIALRLKMDKIGSADRKHRAVSLTFQKLDEAIFWWNNYRGTDDNRK